MQRIKPSFPFLLTCVIAVGILWLTLSPRPTGELNFHLFENQDKVAHALMFGAFTWAVCSDSHRAGMRVRPLLAILAASIFGGAIEIAQEEMHAGRSAEWPDFIADIIGAGSGALLWVLSHRKYKS